LPPPPDGGTDLAQAGSAVTGMARAKTPMANREATRTGARARARRRSAAPNCLLGHDALGKSSFPTSAS
jgi:hypothetical protein